MLAPRIAKPKAKTTAISNTESPLQRSAGRRSGDRANEQSPFLKVPPIVNPPRGQPEEAPRSPAQRPGADSPTPKEPQVPAHRPTQGAKSPAPAAAVITSETVAKEPGAKTRTTIGVGEEVNLTYSAGNTHWATTAGTVSTAKGPSTTLTAPDVAKPVTVSAGTATITFTVIAPNILFMERFPGTGVSHTKGRPDSGIQTTSFLGPDTVNFYNIKYREVNVNAIGSGVYKRFDGIGHDSNPKTIRMFDNVAAGMGTQSRVKDKACSGDPATPAPFETGTLLYIIPNEYQLADGPFHQFAYVTQMSLYNADNNSALYTFKAGASGLTSVGSPTNNPEPCENPAGVAQTGSADPERKHDRAPGRGLSWNFSRVPMRPPEWANRPQSSRLAATPLTHVMQTKLVVGQADDPLEHEADRAAAQVMQMGALETSRVPVRLSRKCADCAEEEPQPLQRQRAGLPDSVIGGAPRIVHEVLRSPGRPLEGDSAAFFRTRFGHDFARVRVHSDGEAAEAAKSVKARAYTIGEHIVFGGGEYAPATSAGRLLLAHELAHVVQQDGGRSSGIMQRREVDDRSCTGLSDVEAEVDTHVNAEIGAARTTVGTSPPALLAEVFQRLGQGIISPIEHFIEALPPSKRNTPPSDLAGTKYSGAGATNMVYLLGTDAVASAVNVHSQCIGADKLGHFFDVGFKYWQADALLHGMSTNQARDIGRALEISQQGLALTGVFSNADQEANLAGWKFYKDLEANPSSLVFAIGNYITSLWNERINPSFYESNLGAVVWNNLLTGRWRGTMSHAGTSMPEDIQFDLVATAAGVTGSYEWPVGAPKPNQGTIAKGTITQQTATVAGQIPGDQSLSASAVTGISIEFEWHRGSTFGRGLLKSVNEQTLEGTWGSNLATAGGGILMLKKA